MLQWFLLVVVWWINRRVLEVGIDEHQSEQVKAKREGGREKISSQRFVEESRKREKGN